MLAESINVLSLSRPLSKSTLPATLEAPLEKSGHRISESVTTFRAPQRLDPHVVAQHELVGVRMQVYLLVYPTLRWTQAPIGHCVAVQVVLEQRQGYD
jgi:hypothetical protein